MRSPRDSLLAARSFCATDIDELVLQVGGFCVERVLEQPTFLRRAPRWEHWSRGAYEYFRRGLRNQSLERYEDAHEDYTNAASFSPGNARIALYHGSLHEIRAEFGKARQTYDAAGCIWRQNIDLTYRSAAARVNLALTNPKLHVDEKIKIVREANESLLRARRRLSASFVWRRVLRSLRPRRRDVGERRYWYSWLRPDSCRRALRLLRRSKGHEYRCALVVSRQANRLSLWKLGADLKDCEAGFLMSWQLVLKIVAKPRSGWLAHWSAAYFFSRAMEIPEDCRPTQELWLSDWKKVETSMASRGLPLDSRHSANDRKAYCTERAIGELSRVVRNPCNQLDRRLLLTDPDMIRLMEVAEDDPFLALLGLWNSTRVTDGIPAQRTASCINTRSARENGANPGSSRFGYL